MISFLQDRVLVNAAGIEGANQFTELDSKADVRYGLLDREQSHVLFNILLIYS